MRIAIISAHSCPVGTLGTKDTGGMSVYIVEVARELAKMGHTVDAYTRFHDPNDPEIVDLAENARLIHLEVGEMAPLDKLLIYAHVPDFTCALEAYRKQHDLEYDLVFSHYWLSTMAGEYFSRWWNVPHVTMFHTLSKVKNAVGVGEKESDLRLYTEEELVNNVYRIIAPTEREKKALEYWYGAAPERIGIVPCGVNTDLFRPVDREKARKETGLENGKIILFVGRIDPFKGIPNLIEAVAHLKHKDEATLVIVGGVEVDEPGIEELRALTKEHGIEDKVLFIGTVDQEKMPSYYASADVCVVPSYYESFGMVTLEALSCGIPVVANDVGDVRNIIIPGKTGYVLERNEPRLLAEKIDSVLANGKTPVAEIRETVSNYSWENIGQALDKEFRRALCNFPVAVS